MEMYVSNKISRFFQPLLAVGCFHSHSVSNRNPGKIADPLIKRMVGGEAVVRDIGLIQCETNTAIAVKRINCSLRNL